jgi:hypothetical protein
MYQANPLIAALKVPREEQIQTYWVKIWTDPAFQRAARCRWDELRKGPFATAVLNAKIDHWVKLLAVAEPRDHAKWKVLGTKIWPNYYVGKTYADEVAWLRDWIAKRTRWIDTNLAPAACN